MVHLIMDKLFKRLETTKQTERHWFKIEIGMMPNPTMGLTDEECKLVENDMGKF